MRTVIDFCGVQAAKPGEVFGASFRRWATFNGVGLAGVAVQLAVLAALMRFGALPVALATAIAVEAALLHNFVWHHHVTWRDRPSRDPREAWLRLGRFHALNGAISLAGNVIVTSVLTACGLNPLISNLTAIILCSTVNFFTGDRVVFVNSPKRFARRRTAAAVAAVLLFCGSSASAAEPANDESGGLLVSGPSAAALAAWDKYVASVEARHTNPASGSFFALDGQRAARWRDRTRGDEVPMVEVEPPGIPDGKIHHWAGAIYVPRTTVNSVVKRLQDYAGRESEFYQEVKASKLLARDTNHVRVFLRLERDAGPITAHFNTEHSVEYRQISNERAVSRSVATKVAEIADAGTPREREKPPGKDTGFLWRLNAYWRFEQSGDGVLIECESVSLSRTVPLLIRPIASPIVNRIARESLERTLRSLRTFLRKQP